jgi:hypothetical protein
MSQKSKLILPIATALAALGGSAIPSNEAAASAPSQNLGVAVPDAGRSVANTCPSVFFNSGEDLLSLTLVDQADGTVIAQHQSHASHASHVSHASSR